MRRISSALSILMLTFGVQSCSSNNSPNQASLSSAQIYTSVAASLTAQAELNPTETSTPQATATSTVEPTQQTITIPTLAPESSSSGVSSQVCDNSAYIGDVTITDGTIVSPGETFTKTWRVQNTGSCNWSTSYLLVLTSGETMSGVSTSVPYVVSSGKQVDISVSMTAPTTTGTYVGHWKLQNPGGTIFGQELFVQIVVATSTSTSTLTPTSTSEATSTPTSTTEPTTAPTETSVPSETPAS